MNVVVSGSSGGIGRAIAERFLRGGHSVFGFDLLERAIDHPAYRHFVFDLRSDQVPELPPVDILINNAGTLEERDAIEVNLLGTIRFTEQLLGGPALKSGLFIASASAR